jgi:hypothetical protein
MVHFGTANRGTLGLKMHKGRLEAFSDGVLAIVLTIMVLERPGLSYARELLSSSPIS